MNKKSFSLVFSSLLLLGCESFEKRIEASYGVPTNAVVIAAAQTQHAQAVCLNGSNNDNDLYDNFYNYGILSGLLLNFHREKTIGFSERERGMIESLNENWLKLDNLDRNSFCDSFREDLEFANSISRIRIVEEGYRFRAFFSIVSEEVISDNEERAKKGTIILGALSLISTLAGANQASQGDFSSAKQLNSYGMIFSQQIPLNIESIELPCKNYYDYIKINLDENNYDKSKYYNGIFCKK